ncbi:hypothetical protein BDZ91DRAFT_736589 [Kalaharituber pfeilii]|nr:hypothetical protein BDZ91DRAFT_736589 [Kalaharituber pfeilii]
MEAATAFNFDILESQFFKLTLGDEQQTGQNNSRTVYYVQRELLASLSPELRKHIDNEMKEGLTGEMVLHEVDKDTLRHFLQWAYVKEYTTDCGPQHTSGELTLHCKLYVFADRFNIGSLKDLSFRKLTSFLDEESNPDPSLSTDVVRAARYAIENLPALTERLVDYLLSYIAWTLDNVRDLSEFTNLIHAHPDAAVALLHLSRRAEKPLSNRSSEIKPRVTAIIKHCAGCGEFGNIRIPVW